MLKLKAAKPGICTTEFWLTLFIVVGSGLATIYADAEWAKVVSLAVGALTAMGYGTLRKNAKAKGEER